MAVQLTRKGRVVTIRLHRPEALNAPDTPTMNDLLRLMTPLDAAEDVGCFIITGSDRAVPTGAGAKAGDAKARAGATTADSPSLVADSLGAWDSFLALRTPKIATVSGHAIGSACVLAMMCDIIITADTATFGRPEIPPGTAPGIVDTQRLARLLSGSRALDLILAGRSIDAATALNWGLVSRVVPGDQLMDVAHEVARDIAARITGRRQATPAGHSR